MRLFNICAAACAVFTVGQAIPAPIENSNSLEVVERDYAVEIVEAFRRDELEPYLEQYVTLSKKDYAVLTTFFTAIDGTGIVPNILNILAQSSLSEPLLAEGIVGFIKVIGISDIVSAASYSNIAQKIIDTAFTDSEFLPGVYAIVNGLTDGASTTPTSSGLNVGSLIGDIAQVPAMLTSDVISTISLVADDLGIGQSNSGIFSILNPLLSIVGIGGGNEAAASQSLSSLATATSVVSTASYLSGTASAVSGASRSASVTSAASTTRASTTSAPASSSSSSSSSSSGILGSIFNSITGFISSIFKRDSEPTYYSDVIVQRDDTVLNNLFDSLVKSGLAIHVIQALVDNSDNYPFVRDLIKRIVQGGVISISDLSSALDSTNLLNNAVINFLSDNDLNISF